MDLETTLNHYRNETEAALRRWLPPSGARPARLHEAMRYSVGAGGKRLRPVLLLAAHDLFASRAPPGGAAAAIECLHTYSLIHDDLPSMDDSDLRRGQPTCHKAFGEATAVLAGDALLTLAFSILTEAYADLPTVATLLVGELSEAAGSRRLIGGQFEDTVNEGRVLSAGDLQFIHEQKTAALFEAALVMGGRVTEADDCQLENLRVLGRTLGLAFQAVDDWLDAQGNSETLGKQTGQDAARQKNTALSVLGIEATRQRVRELTAAAVGHCQTLPDGAPFLAALASSLENRAK